MSDMMANMTVTPSGNADLDFLNGMIPHHESAIDMSGSYLKHGGTNEKLRELAKEIIDEQSDEIEDMKELIEKIETTGEKDPAMEEGYLNASEKMMAEHRQMQHGATSYADVEDAFAEGMIMHHQMAVDMAKAVLNYTNHEEVRDLAEDIIETQEKEIEKMREILNK